LTCKNRAKGIIRGKSNGGRDPVLQRGASFKPLTRGHENCKLTRSVQKRARDAELFKKELSLTGKKLTQRTPRKSETPCPKRRKGMGWGPPRHHASIRSIKSHGGPLKSCCGKEKVGGSFRPWKKGRGGRVGGQGFGKKTALRSL